MDKVRQNELIGNRYELIQKLGQGGMGVVYKVADKLTGRIVALKQVTTDLENMTLSNTRGDVSTKSPTELALANEFSILAGLRHPNIVSVLDYGFDRGSAPFFTMSLLDEPKTITDAAENQPTEIRLKLLVQLLQAMDYLHQRGILHRDIKPENVIVTTDGDVKVLDFGIALSVDYIRRLGSVISGTLAYMAPEVLTGSPVSIQSDLYSFGVLAYEILTGIYPFDRSQQSTLIVSVMQDNPDLSMFDDNLSQVIERLLLKDPTLRYQNALDVINALCDATGYERPQETLAIRESFLQTANFVGRDKELTQLIRYMREAQKRTGHLVLIGGESGTGKSRLLSELRVQSLVENVLVLRGQAVAEGQSPYQVWRDILRWLVILVEIEDLEASVLKDIIPQLESTLGYEVPDAPEVAADSQEERIIYITSELLKRQRTPTVIILEDLQWARQESLTLLDRVSRLIDEMPILILGSYRNDEKPELPDGFAQAEVIELERFDEEVIQRISKSILGEFGEEPQIVNFLSRETEGNAFFIIEVLRVLAGQAGELRKIAEMPLPDELVAGGIIAVLQQRLDRIPEEIHSLLRLAAMMGRQIDTAVIEHLFPDTNLEMWYTTCANYAVLEAVEDTWRFSHDKLRERLLNNIRSEDNTWRSLHTQVAETIETVHTDTPDQIARLAHHWTEADNPSKAVHYLEQAAKQARVGDDERAIDYIKQAETFDSRLGQLSQNQLAFRQSILGSAHLSLGNYENAEVFINKAIQLLGYSPIPEKNWQVGFAIIQQIGLQFMHRTLPNLFIAKRESSHFDKSMLYNFLNTQVIYATRGDMLKSFYAALYTLNLFEELRPTEIVNPAVAYGSFTFFSGMLGFHSLARHYQRLTHEIIAKGVPDLHRYQASALLAFYDMMLANWGESLEHIVNVVDHFNNIGERHSVDQAHNMLGFLYQMTGQWQLASTTFLAAYDNASERQDEQAQLTSMLLLLPQLLRTGRHDEDDFSDWELLIDEVAALKYFAPAFKTNVNYLANYHLLQALYYEQLGNYQDSLHALKKAVDLTRELDIERNNIHLEFYDQIAAVSYRLLNQSNLSSHADYNNLQVYHEIYTEKLEKYAKIYNFAQPRLLLRKAEVAQILGDGQTVLELLRQALEQAKSFEMPYEQYLAHRALASLEPSGNHENVMQELLNQLGTDMVKF